MKKKGFTLIELLAVIVILAIIALIAVPTVINIICSAQKHAFKDSVYGIIKAGELYYQSLDQDITKQEIVLEFPNDTEILGIKGTVPNGIMGIDGSGQIAVGLMNEKYCAIKEYNEKEITITENIKNCKMPKVTYTNGIMSSENNCIKRGYSCSKTEMLADEGIKVKVEVAQNIFNDFYVINDENEELTLIMDRNLYDETDENNGNVAWYNKLNNSSGPLTALEKLKEKTSVWTNINEREYIYSDDGGGNKYNIEEPYLMKARLPKYTELTNLGCKRDAVGCPSYLYQNLYGTGDDNTKGYWTSAAKSDSSHHSLCVYIDGKISFSYTIYGHPYSAIAGIRPVITISK